MARYHGKDGKIVIGSDLNAKVNETSEWNMDVDIPMADASAQGNAFTNVLPGQYKATISVECSYEPADSDGQEALVTAALTGAAVTFHLFELPSATGVKKWSGTAFVNKFGEKVPIGSKVSRSFSLTVDGPLSRDTI
jgi:hypothetical protein